MAERRVTIGIDTSSYTTSVAAVDGRGEVVSDVRTRLSVPPGALGLRQSEAVFQHVCRMPAAIQHLFEDISGLEIEAVTVSDVPRPFPGSYLPVFRVGEMCAATLAASLGRRLTRISHQVGHLACIHGFGDRDCLGVHLSGGTTDLVLVRRSETGGLSLERVGGGVDLHAGQFVDRIGQAMGLQFPAGPSLDSMGRTDPAVVIPVAIKGSEISFSGPHSAALRLLDAGAEHSAVAGAVLACIGRSVWRAVQETLKRTGPLPVMVAGGVAASALVREVMTDRFRRSRLGVELVYADPGLCTDNAVGVARWAKQGME